MSAGGSDSAAWFSQNKAAIYREVIDALLRHLPRNNSGRLLDAGCGYGHIAAALASETAYRITAIDKNARTLDEARKLFPLAPVSFELEDVFSLPYSDCEFDVVVSTGYKCAASLPGALTEVKRVLKDKGTLILDFQRHYHLYSCSRPVHVAKKLTNYVAKRNDQYHFGRFGLRTYLRAYGFEIRAMELLHTWPNFLPTVKSKMLFNRSIGAAMKPILARVFLVVLDPI
jgi:ubiquinone/menaquinone biosynthesis C-methylase UbiE